MPEVRSNTCNQACAGRKEVSPATGVPRARVAAGEAAADSNAVSQRSAQLVIHSAEKAGYRIHQGLGAIETRLRVKPGTRVPEGTDSSRYLVTK